MGRAGLGSCGGEECTAAADAQRGNTDEGDRGTAAAVDVSACPVIAVSTDASKGVC